VCVQSRKVEQHRQKESDVEETPILAMPGDIMLAKANPLNQHANSNGNHKFKK
jgi:hypothetical protein